MRRPSIELSPRKSPEFWRKRCTARAYLPEALTAATVNLHRAGELQIQFHDDATLMWLTRLRRADRIRKAPSFRESGVEIRNHQLQVIVLKVLIIAALFALLLLLLYSRLHPYIQILRKILGAAKTISASPNVDTPRGATSGRKLVRCVGCGTWIPAERAVGNRAGLPVYCSSECIEKKSGENERKMAG